METNEESICSNLIICECGDKSIYEAIKIFQHTNLPYKKAKKLVTGCSKSCCRKSLMRLFDMVHFGNIDIEEVYTIKRAEEKSFFAQKFGYSI